MSLHLTPNEPSDWTHGPDDDPDLCPECGGEGMVIADSQIAHDLEVTCPRCSGSGVVDPPEFDEDLER